jgi:hypothetical protein
LPSAAIEHGARIAGRRADIDAQLVVAIATELEGAHVTNVIEAEDQVGGQRVIAARTLKGRVVVLVRQLVIAAQAE